MIPEASVVICAYTFDRWDDLNAAVASVRVQIPPAKEIFVVIDNNEALRERAEREIEGVKVIPNTQAPGLSGARMSGVALATGSVIVFLDDDAEAGAGWLAELLVPYEDPRVLGVGGHIEPNWRSHRPSWFPVEFNWVVGCTYKGLPMVPWPGTVRRTGVAAWGVVRNLMGASMSVRADVLRGVGGFATKLGRREGGGAVLGVVAESCEETEFCIRASNHYLGGFWVHCPSAKVRHAVPAQRATWKYFVYRCRMEGTAKAVLTGLTGTKDGLGSERRYVLTLVGSVMRQIVAGNFRRAAAICAGFMITVFSYGCARLARARA